MDIYWMPGLAKRHSTGNYYKQTESNGGVIENLKSYYRVNSKSQVDLAPDSQQSNMAYLM